MRTLLGRCAQSTRNVDFDPLDSKTLNRFSGNLACKITSTVCKIVAVTDGWCGEMGEIETSRAFSFFGCFEQHRFYF